MIVALTGGTGALGSVVLDQLLEEGHEVRALVRRHPDRQVVPRQGVRWIEGDLDEVAALDDLVQDSDAILHLAYCPFTDAPPPGRSIVEQFAQTNVVGTMRLIERTPATRERQLVFASSLAVFGPNPHELPEADQRPLDESFPVWPREFYGAHKAALEKLVIAAAGDAQMNASVWRIGCVLGHYEQRERNSLAPTVDEALDGRIQTPKGAWCIAAEDVSTLLIQALGDPSTRGKVIHAFDRWIDFNRAAPTVERVTGRAVEVACDAAETPSPPLVRPALAGREPAWSTLEAFDRTVAQLAHRPDHS